MKISKFVQFIKESNEEYIIQECKLILSDFFDLGTGELSISYYPAFLPIKGNAIIIDFSNFSTNDLKLLLNTIDHLNSFLEDEGYILDEIRHTVKNEYSVWEIPGKFDIKKAISKSKLVNPYFVYEKKPLSEKINIDVEVGDTVYMGRFKNKKTVIKKIDKDETGMPTINGKKVVTFRLKEPKKNPNFKGYRSRFKKKKKED
jgi:hypothetical protein